MLKNHSTLKQQFNHEMTKIYDKTYIIRKKKR